MREHFSSPVIAKRAAVQVETAGSFEIVKLNKLGISGPEIMKSQFGR